MLHASVVTQSADFSALRIEWFELISRSSSATIFDTFEWQFGWWRLIGRKNPCSRLQIVLLRDDSGLLVGILPFYSTIWLLWPMRRLLFIGNGSSDYHDVIAANGYEADVAGEFERCLLELIKYSVADLNQLREGGVLRTYAYPGRLERFRMLELAQEECPFVILPVDGPEEQRWDYFLSEYSKKMRANVRYYDRALDRTFAVDRCTAETRDEVEEVLSALFVLHQRRWNERWLPGVFYSKTTRKFHRMVASDLVERGWLRLHYLKLDGVIEAVLYCFSINGVTSYYQGGFEPTLARLSLGSVITGLAIRQAVSEGNGKFDFLRGDEPYKRRWTQGRAAWNRHWLLAHKGFLLFWIAGAVVRLNLRVERSFKEWMHRRGTDKRVETAVKDDK